MKLSEVVSSINRKMKSEMEAGDFMLALSDKEYAELIKYPDGDNLYDMVIAYAKNQYPSVKILPDIDLPNHAKEYYIDGDGEGWKKNSPPLKLVDETVSVMPVNHGKVSRARYLISELDVDRKAMVEKAIAPIRQEYYSNSDAWREGNYILTVPAGGKIATRLDMAIEKAIGKYWLDRIRVVLRV